MRIQRLEIEGFRSLNNAVWEPGDLNILIGPNGSGKSNLLEALEVLGSAATGNLERTINDSGGVVHLMWNYAAHEIGWKALVVDPKQPCPCEYELRLSCDRAFAEFQVRVERLVAGETTVFHRDGSKLRTTESKLPLPHLMARLPLTPRQTVLGIPVFSRVAGADLVRGVLSGLVCYRDITVGRGSGIRRSTPARRMSRVQSDGQNLVSVIHTHYQATPDFREAIDDAMRAAFGAEFVELMTPPAEDGYVQLRVRWKSLSEPQSAGDLSDGILRFLVLITVLSTPAPLSLIAIDEPETGLHPSMLPIIAEYAVEASRKAQVILTTHSPEFLHAFRDTIPKVTVAFWENGQTVLRTPREDVLQHWLKEYTLGHLMSSGELEELAKCASS